MSLQLSSGEDAGGTITCRADDPCVITCSGSDSCQDDEIDGSDATDVTITCTGTDACKGRCFISIILAHTYTRTPEYR